MYVPTPPGLVEATGARPPARTIAHWVRSLSHCWSVTDWPGGCLSDHECCTFVELRAHRKEVLNELLPEDKSPSAFHEEVNLRSAQPHKRGLLNEKRRAHHRRQAYISSLRTTRI